MTKAEAGRLGGKKTVERYGTAYMRQIGKRGYQTTASRYEVLPVKLAHWVMVRKETGQVVAEW